MGPCLASFAAAPLVFGARCLRGISLGANSTSVVVVYRASAGMRKGADGGHTDCELRVKRKHSSASSALKTRV